MSINRPDNRFAQMARKITSLSPIMEGRTKIKMDDLIRQYPQGVTVTGFDLLTITDEHTGENKTFPVVAIREDPKICFFGGSILKRIILGWVEECGGDVEAASEALEQAGGCHMRFAHGRTRDNKNLISVEID